MIIDICPEFIKNCLREGNFPSDSKICEQLPHKPFEEDQPKKIEFLDGFQPKSVEHSCLQDFVICGDPCRPIAITLCQTLLSALYNNQDTLGICNSYLIALPVNELEIRVNLLRAHHVMWETIRDFKTPVTLRHYIRQLLGIVQDASLRGKLEVIVQECQKLETNKSELELSRLSHPSVEECIQSIVELCVSSKKTIAHDLQLVLREGYDLEPTVQALSLMSFYFPHLENSQNPEGFTVCLYTLYIELITALMETAPAVMNTYFERLRFPTHTNLCCLFDPVYPLDLLNRCRGDSDIAGIELYVNLFLAQERHQFSKPNPAIEPITKLLVETLQQLSQVCQQANYRRQKSVVNNRAVILEIVNFIEPALLPQDFTGLQVRVELSRIENLLLSYLVTLAKQDRLAERLETLCEQIQEKNPGLAKSLLTLCAKMTNGHSAAVESKKK